MITLYCAKKGVYLTKAPGVAAFSFAPNCRDSMLSTNTNIANLKATMTKPFT
jgi:hypothetical protein